MVLRTLKRRFWPIVAGVLALFLAESMWTNSLLRDNLTAYRYALSLQDNWCSGLSVVNRACEATLLDVASRLGLDTDWMPLVNTPLYQRAAAGLSIRRARKRLGAKRWSDARPIASPGQPGKVPTGIGGGTDEDK